MRMMREVVALLLILAFPLGSLAQTPLEKYGALAVQGTHLVDSSGQVVQLKGVATIGLQWFWDFYKNGVAIDSVAQDWKADVVRVTVYIYEEGYLENDTLTPEDFDKRILAMVDACIANGMYCIIDWHVHHPGFPSHYLQDAIPFFDKMAKRYAGVPNVMYEICNEPNRTGYKDIEGYEVAWPEIKEYAEMVIPVIRKYSPDAVVLVGTPAWSSLGHKAENEAMSWQDITAMPLQMKNVLYVLHFYAAETEFWPGFPGAVRAAAVELPLFVTEWSSASYFVTSEHDMQDTAIWLDVLNEMKIGWTYWNFGNYGTVYSPFPGGHPATRAGLHPKTGSVTETGNLLYGFLNE